MFTTISGDFAKFEALLQSDDIGFENARIEFTGATDLIASGCAHRDTRVVSPDFLMLYSFQKSNSKQHHLPKQRKELMN